MLVQHILGHVRSNWLTDLHSGHSKLVIFSHWVFVNSMHFGWYLQQAGKWCSAHQSLAILMNQGAYMTTMQLPSRQAVRGQLSLTTPRIWST